MATFAGIDHLSLSVTDLDASERFYTGVLDFVLVVDFGGVRSLLHRSSAFWLSLVRHPAGRPEPFSELHPGVDHLGLVAADRDELVQWECRFEAAGVAYTPIRDMPLGSHLNFRDPDGIPLEFIVPDAVLVGWQRELCERDVPREEIDARLREHLISRGVPESELPGAAPAVDGWRARR
jgi:catechol 2,3-dioxygenase-like lactoylglutathione lyase family enzyme